MLTATCSEVHVENGKKYNVMWWHNNRFTWERGRASDVTMWHATVRSHFVKTTTYSECSRVEDDLQYLWGIL